MVPLDGTSSDSRTALSRDLDEIENLRGLSVVYGDAGESNRANVLADRALAACDRAQQKVHDHGDVATSLLARMRIIVLLDAARARGQAKRLDEANKLAEEAIALCATTPADSGRAGRSFNKEYRFKIAELAETFRQAGESAKVVAQFLTLARTKLDSGATADVPIDERVARTYGGFYALVDAELAQMLFMDKQNAQALPVVKKAVEECGNNVRAPLRYLAGQIMEANNLYADAAHQYVEGAEFSSLSVGGLYSNAMQTLALQKAASCAEKGKSPSTAETANIYLRLGFHLQQESPREALTLIQKAFDLIPDSDPGKANLPQRIANLKQQIANQENDANAQKAASAAGKEATKTADSTVAVAGATKAVATAGQAAVTNGSAGVTAIPSQPTPEQIHAMQVASSKAQVEAERQSAVLYEKNGRPGVAMKYFLLAQTEAYAEMPKEAIDDARHALRLYHRTLDSLGFSIGMLGSQSDHIESYRLGSQLAKIGHAKDGEDLIHEAMQVTDKAFGGQSSSLPIR